jgi:prepilin-type processing-associated H-X9-DG protein
MPARRAFSLLQLVIVLAIVALLIGLILPMISKYRAASDRTACLYNLKKIALAAYSYHNQQGNFPPGGSPPASASALIHLLPHLEQGNGYAQIDFEVSASLSPLNHAARTQELFLFLCPADPSTARQPEHETKAGGYLGRTNYFGNLGSHAWFRNNEPPTAGLFRYGNEATPTKLSEVTDGISQTALYAEVRRGHLRADDPENVWKVAFETWDENKDENDLHPFPACDRATEAIDYRGLQYFRGVLWCSMYVHTVPPNYSGRDCIRGTGLDRAHLAARSYHPKGVNVAFVDNSVRFISETITPEVWRGMGTRSGYDQAE